MKVMIKHNNKIIFENIIVAKTPLSRMIGLMFSRSPKGDGLLLEPCNSIHTFFMRYSLDVIFLSKTNNIVKIVRNMKPWRMSWIYLKAKRTLEVPSGKLPLEISEGENLEVINV